jgi:tetratricopeptide (TPR) repeat protein
VSFGLLVIFLAWLPTANVLFPTGIVLSERTLYLSTVGLALLAARGAELLERRSGTRGALVVAAIAALPLATRSWMREDVWLSTRRLVLTAMVTQPQSYAVHEALARALWLRGQRQDALREYETAAELFPLDPYLQTRLAVYDLEAGRTRDALRHLLTARLSDSLSLRILGDTYERLGVPDSARAVRARIPPPLPPLSRQH